MIICQQCKSLNVVRLDADSWSEEYLCRDCKCIMQINCYANPDIMKLEYKIELLRKEILEIKIMLRRNVKNANL